MWGALCGSYSIKSEDLTSPSRARDLTSYLGDDLRRKADDAHSNKIAAFNSRRHLVIAGSCRNNQGTCRERQAPESGIRSTEA